MRTLKEIIEIVQAEYNTDIPMENGLCLTSFHLQCDKTITFAVEHLWDWAEDNLAFLYFKNEKEPKMYEKYRGYMWEYNDRDARKQWMANQLNIL